MASTSSSSSALAIKVSGNYTLIDPKEMIERMTLRKPSGGINNVPPHPGVPVKKTFLENLGFGCYPPGYNRRVHGPYYSFRYYGPSDTPLSQVKISELAEWIGRRNKSPLAMYQAMCRARYYMDHKFATARRSGYHSFFQLTFIFCFISYLGLWNRTLKHHKVYKYHW